MMKTPIPVLALMALTSCATGGHASPDGPTFRCGTAAWVEPGKPIIHADVNGRTLRFLVDTGAEFDGWIPSEIADDLGLPVVGKVPSDEDGDPTAGLPFYGVGSLNIGEVAFTNVKFGQMPQVGTATLPFDGIIGNGLFKEMQVTFDYERDTLHITDLLLTKGHSVPFDKYGIPILTLDIDGHPAEVDLDTGNLAGTMFVKMEDAKSISFAGDPIKKGSVTTVSGAFEVMEGTLRGPVRFGDIILPIHAIRWPGAYDSGQLGSRSLRGQTVRVDWRSRRVSIEPEKIAPNCP